MTKRKFDFEWVRFSSPHLKPARAKRRESSDPDPYNKTRDMLGQLSKADVRYVPSLESLAVDQTAMLASFEKADIARPLWAHLKKCDGGPCPNRSCSAACWFGERLTVLQMVHEGSGILSEAKGHKWFVTIIDPRDRCAPKKLDSLTVKSMLQWLRRRLKKLEAEWGPALAIGGVEVSFEVPLKGRRFWGAHFHFVLSTRCPTRDQLAKFFMPPGRLKNSKPVAIKEITNLANATSYSQKRCPAKRVGYIKRDGRVDILKAPVDAAQLLEHDLWLLGQKVASRSIMYGVRRVHGKLVLLKRH